MVANMDEIKRALKAALLARGRNGHSQQQAADAAGVGVGAWGRWERGEATPGLRYLGALERYARTAPSEEATA